MGAGSAEPAWIGVPRFYYLVRPLDDQWEVAFGGTGERFAYGTRSEAIQVAKGAARLHWETRNELSGVQAEDANGRVRTVASYGP